MASDQVVDSVLGLALILFPVSLMGAALFLILRLSARGELRRGLGYIFYLPGRRRSLYRLVSGAVVLFLLSGVVNGLTLWGGLSESPSDYAIAVSDIGASIMLLLVLVVGLRPTKLSDAERTALAKEPMALAALGLVQSIQDGET